MSDDDDDDAAVPARHRRPTGGRRHKELDEEIKTPATERVLVRARQEFIVGRCMVVTRTIVKNIIGNTVVLSWDAV